MASSEIASSALETVHTHVRACTACPLANSRTQAVPGVGRATARIMAVGEAPGEKEDLAGEPFVGAAGQLLNKLLVGSGLSREDIYITNTIKCRPPGNRDPDPSEVAACSHFLDAQIEIIRPDVILLLGRHAVARLLPDLQGISKIHGQKVQRGDRLYMPLYHPAAALYNGSLLQTLQQDMEKVREVLDDLSRPRS